jgi:hypothetical protein
MRRRPFFGIIALAFAVPALVLALAESHAAHVWIPSGGHVLNFLDSLGLVRHPRSSGVPVWDEASLFMINDEGGLLFLAVYSVSFAVFAMLFTLWAEYREEATASLSAAFICATLALGLFSFAAAMGTMIAGGILVSLIRQRT